MRVFIAIEIDKVIKDDLADLQREILGKTDLHKGDAKWVDPEDMHLTLKFLGEINDAQLVNVCNITKEVTTKYKCFDIEIAGVGSFGGQSARVLWVGAGQDNENLLKLQEDLETQLAFAGWPEENRKFEGHLTLCRIKNFNAGIKLAQLAKEYEKYSLDVVPVEAVCIFQSELTPKGPVYTLLGKYNLQKTN
ncbi:MAG: RNA 2',3'-cyclic phosphodiesterase [Sedimentisphaerales bacterium]|nr:RNA 2',3'-cyclic phosphodiesterase [Sedimentisphaerales bacterium]